MDYKSEEWSSRLHRLHDVSKRLDVEIKRKQPHASVGVAGDKNNNLRLEVRLLGGDKEGTSYNPRELGLFDMPETFEGERIRYCTIDFSEMH